MLRITREQREIVGDPAFVARLVQHFTLFHFEAIQHLPEDVLRKRLRHGLEKARGYGLTWEYNLTVFLAHMIRIHPEFHLQPAIHRVLKSAALPPDERINALPAEVTDEDWDAAAGRGNPEIYWRAIGAPSPLGRR